MRATPMAHFALITLCGARNYPLGRGLLMAAPALSPTPPPIGYDHGVVG